MGNVCSSNEKSKDRLIKASRENKVHDVIEILNLNGREVINSKIEGFTALYTACSFDCLGVVQTLCQSDGIDVNIPCLAEKNFKNRSVNFKGGGVEVFGKLYYTPIAKSVELENFEVVETLLKHNELDINSGTYFEKLGEKEISVNEMVDSPQGMIEVGNIGEQTPFESPLFLAVLSGNKRIVDLLLRNDVNPNIGSSRDGSPLRLALDTRRFDIFESIIRHENINIHVDETEWRKPILSDLCSMVSTEKEAIKLIEMCLKKMSIDLQGEKSSVPLFFAVEYKRADLLHFLVNHPKLEINSFLQKKTVLQFACERLEEGEEEIEIVRVLLNHPKIDINLTKIDGGGNPTPFFIASKLNKVFILKQILDMRRLGKFVDVNVSFEGKTALEVTTDENMKVLIREYS